LTKNDISELKGMKSPPAGVKLVMEAVCIMKNIKPTRMKDPGGSGKVVENCILKSHKRYFRCTKFIEMYSLWQHNLLGFLLEVWVT